MSTLPVFQVVTAKPMSGVSKAGNDYNMLIVGGVFTDSDGNVEMGEIVFMMGRDRQRFPAVEVGKRYTPTVSARSVQGKLEFKVVDLQPIAKAA